VRHVLSPSINVPLRFARIEGGNDELFPIGAGHFSSGRKLPLLLRDRSRTRIFAELAEQRSDQLVKIASNRVSRAALSLSSSWSVEISTTRIIDPYSRLLVGKFGNVTERRGERREKRFAIDVSRTIIAIQEALVR